MAGKRHVVAVAVGPHADEHTIYFDDGVAVVWNPRTEEMTEVKRIPSDEMIDVRLSRR
jgi:hypothetical protein